MVDAIGTAFWIATILHEILWDSKSNFRYIECRTDSGSLNENLQSFKPLLDKRLRVDIASIREMLEKEELKKVTWIGTESQLADSLTKKGASCDKLLEVIKNEL